MKIFYFLLLFEYIHSLIVIPFKISSPQNNSLNNKKYSINDFIDDYIIRDFYTTIDIGTPFQKLFAIITPDSHLFSLSSDEYIPKNFELNNEFKLISNKGYIPSFSSSFSKIKNITLSNKNYRARAIISESILLNNENKEKTKIDNINIIFEEDNNRQKHAIIGINYDTYNKNIPFIVNELKRLNITKNYNWYFKFISKTEGEFIIGSLPHKYEEKSKLFDKNTYTKVLSSSVWDYSYPWSIHFNQIYFLNNSNEQLIISQTTKCYFTPNLGFIIGNSNYKKLILENYFKDLIENDICTLEKTELTKYNKSFVYYGTSGIYEFFVCDKNKFVNNKINYKKKFMPLFFDLSKYNYTFYLDENDLFLKFNNKYYFLVAFPEEQKDFYYIKCFLFLSFYRKYRLIFNYDSKTFGFYNQNISNINDENKDKYINDNKLEIDNKLNDYYYMRIIVEILICILLVIVAYFIGKKINEKRKRRANELVDDYYEYISENNKDVNDKMVNNNIEKEEIIIN